MGFADTTREAVLIQWIMGLPHPDQLHHATRHLWCDSKVAQLVDLSSVGVQMVSPTILSNSSVRVLLPEPNAPVRMLAVVA